MTRDAMRVVVVIGLLLAAARPARAQLVYEFANAAGVAQSNFSVPVGSSVAIRVYIHETSAGAATLNANGGLGTGAVRVTFDNPSGVASVQATGDISPGPAWAFGTPAIDSTSARLVNGSSITSGVLPDTEGRILLGTFIFQGLAEGSVTLGALDPNPGVGYDTSSFATSANIPLTNYDPLLQSATATLTVTPVPEPAALGLAAAALLAARRLRRAVRVRSRRSIGTAF